MDKKIVEDFIKELEKEEKRLQSRIYEIQSKGDERTVKEDREMKSNQHLIWRDFPDIIFQLKFMIGDV